ncbi:AP2 domain [Yersinia frederiksenii]|nr:AP2 domain [Yersinia frederiksenii]
MKALDSFTVERLGEIKNAFLDCNKETAPSIGEIFTLIDIALAAKRAEPVSLESAIEKFKEYNIGFPVEKLKADFVISWCLTNLTPQLNSPVIPEGCPEFAEIYVGNDLFALCDWESFDKVKGYKWALTTRGRSGNLYAQAWRKASDGGREKISMHRLICGEESGVVYDHINGNGLDNRLCNLRKASAQQNSFNQKSRAGSSIYKGVSFDKEGGLWRSYITVDGKRKYLGRHAEEVDAAKAYDVAAIELFGSFARLNLAAAPEK